MLPEFGFSFIGLLFLAMLIVPNLMWVSRKPTGYTPQGENPILVGFEKIGQALVSVCALVFRMPSAFSWTSWSWWLVAAFLFMLAYEAWWARYFRSKRTLSDFYGSFLGIPVAGATLPIIAFFLLGIYGRNVWLLISDVILGIGHIGLHWQHRKQIRVAQ